MSGRLLLIFCQLVPAIRRLINMSGRAGRVGVVAVEGDIGGVGGRAQYRNIRHPAIGHVAGDIAPRAAAVFGHRNDAVGRASVNRVLVIRSDGDGRDPPAGVRPAREITADRLPRIPAIAGAVQPMRAQIEHALGAGIECKGRVEIRPDH